MCFLYKSLNDPSGLIPDSIKLRWPAEPPLGGWYTEEEVDAAIKAIRASMDWRVGFQASLEVKALEDDFSSYIGTYFAIAFNGAGTALDMVLRALSLGSEDEVVSCAINFHGTHLAVLGTGAKLILCEPDPVTLNLDPKELEKRLSVRTRAILVTHMNGLSADTDAILDVAARNPHPAFGPPKVISERVAGSGTAAALTNTWAEAGV